MSESASLTILAPPVRGRSCGSCKACCIQVPVVLPGGHKPANTRCPQLHSKGCRIYAARPHACRVWSCRWLFDEGTVRLRRPDLAGYVIDPMLDTIMADNRPLEALQVWVDPQRREAHRDPALRAYLLLMAVRHRLPAIVRWSSSDGMLLSAPPFNEGDDWLELGGDLVPQQALDKRLAAIGAQRVVMPL